MTTTTTPSSGLVLHITGARPNFPKAAPVIAALRARGAKQLLVHTGQHFDDKLSAVFFRELDLPEPDINLGVGSGSHAAQTGQIMALLEPLFIEHEPAVVVVYGDVNSTVAASLVAAKLGIPVAHVEAGLRSFDRTMPEEINRLVVDTLADVLLTTSVDAVAHLGNEGIDPAKIHFVGNPMIDTLLGNVDRFDVDAARATYGLIGDYAVATLHRPANVDTEEDARALVAAVHGVADQVDMVFPVHPRGRAVLAAAGLEDHPRLTVVDPLGYIDFMSLVRGAALVATDSGGIQEETTMFGVPCLTVRPNTERPVTITHGTNKLVTRDALPDEARKVLAAGRPTTWRTPALWDGKAGERIADVLEDAFL